MPRTSAAALEIPSEPPRPKLPRTARYDARTSRRDEVAMELCEGLIDISAALFGVSGKELRSARRTALGVSRVRQIAMYVAHVVLGLSTNEVGRGFGRDRTTVVHSCQIVEDMRDNIEFETVVSTVERVASVAFRNRLEVLR